LYFIGTYRGAAKCVKESIEKDEVDNLSVGKRRKKRSRFSKSSTESDDQEDNTPISATWIRSGKYTTYL